MINLPTKILVRFFCAVSLVGVPVAFGENLPTAAAGETPPASSSVVASGPDAATRTIEQYGLTFVLARSVRNDGVDTEEYFLKGETDDTWSQMITYQRIALPEPMGADQYVTGLKKHLEQAANGPRLRVVQQGKSASIFGVQYAKVDGTDGQFGLALVTRADARRPNELHVIQYAAHPSRLSVEELQLQVKRWQARFQSQAATISP